MVEINYTVVVAEERTGITSQEEPAEETADALAGASQEAAAAALA